MKISSLCRTLFGAFLLLVLQVAFSGCGKSEILSPEPSALDLDGNVPSCPGLTSVTVGAGPSLSLVWGEGADDVSKASNISYSVFMRSLVDEYDLVSPTKIVNGATTTIITNGVQLGQTYRLFVSCKDEAGNYFPTGPKNEKTVTVSDNVPPSQITDLAVGSANYTSLMLTWSPSDDGSGGTLSSQMKYRIYSSTTSPVSTSGTPIHSITNGATTYTHSGLVPGTAYYYRIVAEDLAGNRSDPSNQAMNSTLTDSTAPTLSPSGLATSSVGSTSIGLTWTNGTDNVNPSSALVYNIYRCSGATTCNPYGSAAVSQTGPGVLAYSDTGLAPNTIYVYGVRAQDSSGNISINSDVVITSTTYNNTGSFYAYPTNFQAGIRLGRGVAVGNVVGDASGSNAFADLIIGAPEASEPGLIHGNTGCVYIFAGTSVGQFSSTPIQTICQPGATTSGGNARNFGNSIVAGDLDADGYTDLVISNPQRNFVYIYRTSFTAGGAGVLSLGAKVTSLAPGSSTAYGLGLCLGNSDGIGAPDIFVVDATANCTDSCGFVGTGNVKIFSNISTSGNFTVPVQKKTLELASNLIAAPNNFNLMDGEVVATSCTVGKFDPNAPTSDILVVGSGNTDHDNNTGNQNDGHISFFRLSPSADGSNNQDAVDRNNWIYANTIRADQSGIPGLRDTQWGYAVEAIQADASSSRPELFVGAPSDSSAGTNSGAVYGYSVSSSGGIFSISDLGNYYFGGSDQNSNGAGVSIAAGNIWGHLDGAQDMVIGAYLDDRSNIPAATGIDIGDVFTYRNQGNAISSTIQQKQFDTSSVNARIDNLFGRSLCKGDLNHDGYPDVAIGAAEQFYDPSSLTYLARQGAMYIYYGKSSGETDFANPDQIIFSPGNQSDGRFGYSCAIMDYNGDSVDDLLVGSPWRDVGANWDRGAVYVYFGSSGSQIPESNSAVLNAPLTASGVLFGFSMATGDFDNDGHKDLAVGSPYYDSIVADSGAVWIFWADKTTHALKPTSDVTYITPPYGAVGTGGNPHLANTQPTGETNIRFGFAVGSFKTVAGSSGVDLIVCAPYIDIANASYFESGLSAAYTDIGNCYIYEGKVNGGLTGDYKIMTAPKNEIRYPYQWMGSNTNNNHLFGSAIAVGNWDNDSSGTEDLIICGYQVRNPDSTKPNPGNAGGCFTYLGRVGGGFESPFPYLPNAAGTRYVPIPDDAIFNNNAESSSTGFGMSALMVDINNNGRQDLLIGEPQADNAGGPANLGRNSGRVYINRGDF